MPRPTASARIAAAAVATTCAVSLLAVRSTSAAASSASLAPATAVVEADITTTSDWTTIALAGVTPTTWRTVTQTGGGTVVTSGPNIGFNGTAGPSRHLVIDMIVVANGANVGFKLTQGYSGRTSFTLTDVRSKTVLGTLSNPGGSAGGAGTTASPSSAMFSGAPLGLPHGDARRLTLAFYYPWFSAPLSDPSHMADQPSDPQAGTGTLLAQARSNGVDGFIESFDGDTKGGRQLDTLRRASEAQGATFSAVIETLEATNSSGQVDPAIVEQWLQNALTRTSSPAWLTTSDGLPVVFVYSMASLPPSAWATMAADAASAGHPVHLVGDVAAASYAPVQLTHYRYTVNGAPSDLAARSLSDAIAARGTALLDPTQAAVPSLATVSPGYNDQALRGKTNPVIDRANGQRYDGTWDAAVAGDPDWVLVTTWNEWFEGTEIQPGTANGDLALQQTATRTAAWRSASSPAS